MGCCCCRSFVKPRVLRALEDRDSEDDQESSSGSDSEVGLKRSISSKGDTPALNANNSKNGMFAGEMQKKS